MSAYRKAPKVTRRQALRLVRDLTTGITVIQWGFDRAIYFHLSMVGNLTSYLVKSPLYPTLPVLRVCGELH